jgi:hypothetical protein
VRPDGYNAPGQQYRFPAAPEKHQLTLCPHKPEQLVLTLPFLQHDLLKPVFLNNEISSAMLSI